MKNFVFGLLLLMAFSVSVDAQNYNTGIGFRGGLSNGFTIKHFVSSTNAVKE